MPSSRLAWPSAAKIWRVKAATEVLPLVPVTATIVARLARIDLAAASASARRTLATRTKATVPGKRRGRRPFGHDCDGARHNRLIDKTQPVSLAAGGSRRTRPQRATSRLFDPFGASRGRSGSGFRPIAGPSWPMTVQRKSERCAHVFTQSLRDRTRWYVVDAEGLASAAWPPRSPVSCAASTSRRSRPHLDTGDHVIIVNADKVVLTSGKAETKQVYRHTGYPGGIRSATYAEMLARKPTEAVRRTIRGMLPKDRLGRQMLSKLKVYAGPDHPHAAQKPKVLDLADARARS